MKSYDAQKLGEILNGLAEAFDKKPVSARALEIWFDALKEFPSENVFPIISTWAKHHAKFPAPSEVWKAVNEIGIEEREKTAAAERHQAREPIRWQRSEAGAKAMVEIRKLLGMKKTPREHWHTVLSTHKSGSIGHDYALEALKILDRNRRKDIHEDRIVERQPGEDLEEAA